MDVTLGLAHLPRHLPDLRPSADAAASIRETAPPPTLAIGPAEPPIAAQAMSVGRAMIAANPISEVRDVASPERRLVPFGIDMLPREIADGSAARDERG